MAKRNNILQERIIGGEKVLICGTPDLQVLEEMITGSGDLWHSGLQRGCAGLLAELKYWSPVYWYYLNDIDPRVSSVSWRVEHEAFAVRSRVWETIGGLDTGYISEPTRALDLGFRLIQNGGIPLHVPGLFAGGARQADASRAHISKRDIYLFFARHFKRNYRLYMLLRETMVRHRPLRELRALRWAEDQVKRVVPPTTGVVPPRPLQPMPPKPPRVSAIVPTMRRQEFTANLLADYERQTLPLHQVFVVDATPEGERTPELYEKYTSVLPLQVVWQQSLGACRARNEAIRLCTGDYILFADDDTRVPPDFVDKHVRLLETYHAEASNGLDVRADHHEQGLDDLARKLSGLEHRRQRVGVSENFNNANSCVRREWVNNCVGNDVNFDGGYGDDGDFGHCLIERGGVVLYNPYATNLHLKPPAGGFRWWGTQASLKGELRKRQPWELKRRVGRISPRPGPTIMYSFLKHYTEDQVREWLYVYLLRWWVSNEGVSNGSGKIQKGRRIALLLTRVLGTPYKLLRIRVSYRFAKDLIERGPIFE